MRKFHHLLLFLLILLSGCVSAVDQHIENVVPEQTSDVEVFTPTSEILLSSTPLMTPPTGTSTSTPPIDTNTPTPQPTLPDEHYITGVYGHKQYFPLGCESGVAVDWASFFGVEINEFEFQTSLPLSDNPELGFVGSVDGPWGQIPPYAYGIHAAPVAELLQSYGLDAQAEKGYTLQELKYQIAMDQPVIAWVIGNVVGGVPYEYTDSQGNTATVAAYEHVIIVIGYSQDMIRYNNNGRVYDIPIDVFENSWSVLGNMVLIMGKNEIASDETLLDSSKFTVWPCCSLKN